MKKRELTAKKILGSSDYRDKGVRRWDLSEHLWLFCSASEIWWNGPQVYEGWTLTVEYPSESGDGFTNFKISRDEAWDILTDKYGSWKEAENKGT